MCTSPLVVSLSLPGFITEIQSQAFRILFSKMEDYMCFIGALPCKGTNQYFFKVRISDF